MSQEYKITVDADLEEIMPRYLEIRREELEALTKAIENKDIDEVRMLGHRLKGTGSSYGIDELTEIGTVIEDTAKVGSLQGVAAQADRLRFILDNIIVEYEEI